MGWGGGGHASRVDGSVEEPARSGVQIIAASWVPDLAFSVPPGGVVIPLHFVTPSPSMSPRLLSCGALRSMGRNSSPYGTALSTNEGLFIFIGFFLYLTAAWVQMKHIP